MKPDIEFKPLAIDDFPLLSKWFNLPHIKQWYARGETYTIDDIKEKYLPRIEDHESVPNYIIYANNKAIGYIQMYLLTYSLPDGVDGYDHPLFARYRAEEMIGIDLFIADVDFLGSGISSMVINEFIDRYIKGKYSAIAVDPLKENQRAIRFFEKLGFEVISCQGQNLLMLLAVS